MKKSVILLVLICLSFSSFAQKAVTAEAYGWVRNDIFVDTYKGHNVVKDQFYLIPKYGGQDANGEDINEQLSTEMISIMTRFGAKFNGPEVFGAKSMAHVESDFLGNPSTAAYLVRIRHAYIKFAWDKSNFLIGQYWHPFFIKAMPKVVAISTGVPFQPFGRTPQLTYSYNTGLGINFMGSALYELQHTSFGPNGASDEYRRNAVIPELLAGIEFAKGGFSVGASAELKQLRPRLFTVANNGDKYIADETVNAFNYMGYLKYTKDKFYFTAKAVYGNDLTHMVGPGGYAISSTDAATGKESYTNYNYFTSFVNAVYGKDFQVGAFAGYAKNLGTNESIESADKVFGRFLNVDNYYRGSVHTCYIVKNIHLIAEYEYTVANYGIGSMDLENGLYSSLHQTANSRVNLGIVYNF